MDIRTTYTFRLRLALLISLLSLASGAACAKPLPTEYDATVSSQSEFDRLLASKGNREVNALIKPGTYVIDKTRHVAAPLRLKGEGAVITQNNRILTRRDAVRETATHYVCPAKGIGEFSLFVDAEGNVVHVAEEVDPTTEINLVDGDIVPIVDETTSEIQTIKIRIPSYLGHLKNRKFDKAFGHIDSWWTTPSFVLTHSDSDYLYCNLNTKRTTQNFKSYVDGERSQYHQPAAFVLFNIRPQEGRVFFDNNEVYIPKDIEQIEIIDSSFGPMFMLEEGADLAIDGIDFRNCTDIFQCSSKFNGSLTLDNCNFTNTLKRAFLLIGSRIKNVAIENCTFTNYSLYFFEEHACLLRTYASEAKGRISGCVFNQFPDGYCHYKNAHAPIFINHSKEFDITGNTFINHPRGALYLMRGRINVDSNHFYNDSTFNSHPLRNFSRDGGAVYCNMIYDDNRHSPENPHRIQVRLNTIHDVIGKGDINGIFIDDGRGDVTCYGNVIYNGQAYSIDSRVVKSDPYSSIRNNYSYNVVGYPYRLTYGDSIRPKERPVTDRNILLFTGKDNKTTTPSRSDIRTSGFEVRDGELRLDNKVWKKLPKDVRRIVRKR